MGNLALFFFNYRLGVKLEKVDNFIIYKPIIRFFERSELGWAADDVNRGHKWPWGRNANLTYIHSLIILN